MARATNCSRWSAGNVEPFSKSTTPSDHWRMMWASATASGVRDPLPLFPDLSGVFIIDWS
jgi:hypothetical protein